LAIKERGLDSNKGGSERGILRGLGVLEGFSFETKSESLKKEEKIGKD